jgi:hypothetical protein
MRRKINTALNTHRHNGPTLAAMQEMYLYCKAHPRSPAAMRRPELSIRGDLWIAVLGPNVEKGIVGIGPSVAAALRAFDAQYFQFLGSATDATKIRDSTYSHL